MKSDKKGLLTLVLVIIIAFAVVGGVNLVAHAIEGHNTAIDDPTGGDGTTGGNTDGGTDVIPELTPPYTFTPGEYYGQGKGAGTITVKVTFSEDAILDVKIINYPSESAGYYEEPVADLPGMIVEANSWEVDAISGATMTSNGIMKAVKHAANQAAGLEEILEYGE